MLQSFPPPQNAPPNIDASSDLVQAFAAAKRSTPLETVARKSLENPLPEPATTSRTRVLIVDDEPISRKILARCLGEYQCTVEEAADGFEALVAIRRERPDLVLLDFQMPKFDGLRTIRMIRQIFKMNELAVVMMTASDRREQMIAAFENGANDFISKPIDKEAVLARIRAQISVCQAQRALRESEERYALAAIGTNDGLWDWNLDTGDLYLSPRWLEMLGIEGNGHSMRGPDWMKLIHPEDALRVFKDLELHLIGVTDHFETELRMQHSSQTFRWMLCRGSAIRNEQSVATRIAGSLSDITDGKVADALTSLPNRNLFHDRITRNLESFRRLPTNRFAVIYVDIDGFKQINDSFGHESGDAFLVTIARRLETVSNQNDAFVARLGGDEFAILVENLRDIESVTRFCDRILERLKLPVKIGDRELLISASMGIAISDATVAVADEMLRQADTAMYAAKKYGGQCYRIFHTDMIQEQSRQFELVSELRHAVRRDELMVHFQPLVDINMQSTAGFEALLRWYHPVYGLISPATFIPLAESSGIIIDIGKWVLQRACEEAVVWQSTRPGTIVSVNVSVRQLADADFVPSVIEVLATTGISPHLLKLEVTESLIMQNAEEFIGVLQQLQSLGVTIGLDDFGTGYSSLSYLHQLPLNVLKIDRSFVMSMTESDKNMAIVRTIVALAKSLKLETIAEGVESSNHAKILIDLGCNMLQGFLFSPAVPGTKAREMLNTTWTI